MNFGELIELIGDQTTKPELDLMIRQRINSSVRLISLSGRYWPDRITGELTSLTKENDFTFAIPTRFRAVDFIKYKNQDRQINRKEPSRLYRDPTTETDIYYLTKSSIIISTAEKTDAFSWAYWEYPAKLEADNDSNWITELLGATVADMVTQIIFGMLGERVETGFFQQLQAAELQIMVDDVLGDHTPTVMSGRA